MIRIVFLSGSSRRSSDNARLSGAVARLAATAYPDRVVVDVIDLNRLRLPQATAENMPAPNVSAADLPLADAPAEDPLVDVATVVEAVGRGDALFVGSDEYSGTFSTQLRCAVDWIQLLATDRRPGLRGKPVAICSAAPQGIGGMRGLPSLRQLFEVAGARVTTQHLNCGTHGTIFAADGTLLPFAERQLIDGALAWILVQTDAAA